jgi:regulatory protein
VRERLRRRSLPEADTERVVARLLELKLLDDRSFAEAYVARRSSGRGRLALQQELRRKGVAPALIESALATQGGSEEGRAAVALLRKQAWRFTLTPDADAAEAARVRSRAYALLARRGFAPDAVHAAVDDLFAAFDAGDEP